MTGWIYLVTENVHIDTGNNSTIQSNYRTTRIARYCLSIITDPHPCFTVGTRHSGF